MKLSSVFGVINASWEHFTQVSSEGAQALREVCIEILVQEHQVYETIVQYQGPAGPDQLQEQCPH